jgi:hypothetical protein
MAPAGVRKGCFRVNRSRGHEHLEHPCGNTRKRLGFVGRYECAMSCKCAVNITVAFAADTQWSRAARSCIVEVCRARVAGVADSRSKQPHDPLCRDVILQKVSYLHTCALARCSYHITDRASQLTCLPASRLWRIVWAVAK